MTTLELVDRDLKKARINLDKALQRQNVPKSEIEHLKELVLLREHIAKLVHYGGTNESNC